jgi:hypothetical protein
LYRELIVIISSVEIWQVGTITLTALTGLLILMSFLLVGTANTIIVSVLMSLAAARGFLALFFACLVAVYVGAVSIATFAISTTVITSIAGVLIATGKTLVHVKTLSFCICVNMGTTFSRNSRLNFLTAVYLFNNHLNFMLLPVILRPKLYQNQYSYSCMG